MVHAGQRRNHRCDTTGTAPAVTDTMIEVAARALDETFDDFDPFIPWADLVRIALEAALAGRTVVDLPGSDEDTEWREYQARLYSGIERSVEYALTTFAGFTQGGSRLDHEGWHGAPLPELLAAIMTHIRAGLSPAITQEAVQSGVWWARQLTAESSGDGGSRG